MNTQSATTTTESAHKLEPVVARSDVVDESVVVGEPVERIVESDMEVEVYVDEYYEGDFDDEYDDEWEDEEVMLYKIFDKVCLCDGMCPHMR